MKNLKFLFLFLLGFIFSACVDEIELDESLDVENSIAIQGSLIKGDPSIVNVFVSRLSNLNGVNLPKSIVNAQVFLIQEDGTELELDNINSGYYELKIPANHPDFNVEVNNKYQLRVLADGNTYESVFELLPPVPEVTSLQAKVITREVINSTGFAEPRKFISYSVNSPLRAAGETKNAQLIWELIGTFQFTDTPDVSCRPTSSIPDAKTCYIYEFPNIDEVVLFDGTKVSTTELVEHPIFETSLNFRFAEGYYLSIFQQALTPSAFDYWTATNDMLQRTGSIFEAPAGKIESNFTNLDNPAEEVFGYFYATQQDIARVLIDPASIDFPESICPVFFDPLSPPAECCDCLKLEQAEVGKPDWW